MDDHVKRFLSKQEWRSLVESKPVQLLVQHSLLKRVQFMEDKQESLPSEGPAETETSSNLVDQQKIARYKALKGRLKVLAQPKVSPKLGVTRAKWSWADETDNPIGPGQYEVRLDIAKPSRLSTIPNRPVPVIRQSTSVGRSRDKWKSTLLSPKVSSISPLNDPRPSTVHRSRKELSSRPSFSRSQGRLFDFRRSLFSPDAGSYTPTFVPSQKNRFSVPKSTRKFNISRCNHHSDSLLNAKFNSVFLT